MSLINYAISPLFYSTMQLLCAYFHKNDPKLEHKIHTVSSQFKVTTMMCGIGIMHAAMLSYAELIFQNSEVGIVFGLATFLLTSSTLNFKLKNEKVSGIENLIISVSLGTIGYSFGKIIGSSLELVDFNAIKELV